MININPSFLLSPISNLSLTLVIFKSQWESSSHRFFCYLHFLLCSPISLIFFHFQISYEPFGCCHLVSFDLYSYYLVSLFAFSAVNCSLSANYPCRNIIISSDSEVEDGDIFADNALRYVHHHLTQLISVLILSTLDSIVWKVFVILWLWGMKLWIHEYNLTYL